MGDADIVSWERNTRNRSSGLSWRVHLLPYMGDQEKVLYKKFHLDEPWNSTANRALIPLMPSVFGAAGYSHRVENESGKTCFLAAWELQGWVLSDNVNTKKPSSAPCVIEINEAYAVPWTRPVMIDVRSIGREEILNRHSGKYFVLLNSGAIELHSIK